MRLRDSSLPSVRRMKQCSGTHHLFSNILTYMNIKMIPLRKFQFNFVILSEFDGIVLSVFLGGFHIGFVIRCYTSGI